MSTLALAVSALCQLWVALYTAGLPRDQRDTRRREIASDLWESHSDARRQGCSDVSCALVTLSRCAMGIPSDLLWRAEHASARGLRPVAIAGAMVVAVSLLWIAAELRMPTLPEPPAQMTFAVVHAAPPPPPPPPAPDGLMHVASVPKAPRDGTLP